MPSFTPIRRILSNRRGNGLDEIRAQYGIEPCGFDSHWPESERIPYRTSSESAPSSVARVRDTPPSVTRARETPPPARKGRGNHLDQVRAQYGIEPCGFDSHWPEAERVPYRDQSQSRSRLQVPSHPSLGRSCPAPAYDDAPPPYSPGMGYARRTASHSSRAQSPFVSDVGHSYRPTNYESYNRTPQPSTSGAHRPSASDYYQYEDRSSYNRNPALQQTPGSRYYRR